MNNFTIFIVSCLSKKRQKRWFHKQWEKKSDETVRESYKDAMDWLQLEVGRCSIELPDSLLCSLNHRLEEYIIPQLKRRNLYG